ncbi:hypothetical protein ACIHDR_37915 [Nocardia sp. NPDC052278]|uniref:hypothetical protein n=1 Tax=unclassified Nocardia TaxID=2637762 RepID=UPI0036C4E773
MSTEQDRERSLENEVPEGVSPTATRTGTEGDSAAPYGSVPISEAEASGGGATSAAGSAGREGTGESTAAADQRTPAGEGTATGSTAAGTSTVADERTAADESADTDERTAAGQQEVGDQPLFGAADVERLRTAWRQLQGSFVDSPHDAVTQADDLVMATVQQLSATLAERKQSLERLWSREEDGDTEDLRLALRSYRAFFDQLVGTGK